MNPLPRFCLLALALAAPCSHAAPPDPALIGCWRAAKIVLHAPDGATTEDSSGRCTLHFADAQLESACVTSGGRAITTYRYQVVRPRVYATTMTGSTFRTSLVGSTREYEYHVDGDRLVTASLPPTRATAGAAGPARVETEAERVPCE